ncbi:MAG: T9SS type A sorting domain-containing protein [Candidatus Kapabacteria bacterium]|nr:T9SS type A sorting domain-containing protein [Candidatus Kapabacteria bacterium]
MIAPLLLAAVLDTFHVGGPFTKGRLPDRINEASGMVASAQHDLLWLVNDSGGEPSVYGVADGGTQRVELRLTGAKNVDWEDVAYNPVTKTIYVADIGDNAARRASVRIYSLREPSVLDGPVMDVAPTVRDLVYPDGARDAETLLCDPVTADLFVVSKRERRNRLYRVPAQGDTLAFVTDLPFYLATGGDISADGRYILVKNYAYVYGWTRWNDERVDEAMRRAPYTVHYMPEPQGECLAIARDVSGFYTVTEREDGGPLAPIEFYPVVPTRADVDRVRDVRRPSIQVVPEPSARGRYTIRYAVTEEANVSITVRNMLGMTVATPANNIREAGAQERNLDLSTSPDGTYIVMLRVGTTYASTAIEHHRQ